VRARAEQGTLRLHPPNRVHQHLLPSIVCKPPVQISQPTSRTLHGNQGVEVEAALAHLILQLVGPVKVGRREPIWMPPRIPVLSLAHVSLDYPTELRLSDEPACESVVGGCKSGDRGSDQDTTRLQDSSSF
jgi:hypothetical protein